MLSFHYIKELIDLGFVAVGSPNYRLAPTISARESPVQDAKDSYVWFQTRLPELLARGVKVHLDGNRIVRLGHIPFCWGDFGSTYGGLSFFSFLFPFFFLHQQLIYLFADYGIGIDASKTPCQS
jgi:hypothetical protein